MKKVPNLRFKEFSGEWESKKIGSICEIIMGQSPSSACYNEDKIGLPLIQGNADIKNRKTFPRVYTSDITKTCDVGDIIMSVRAPVGAISKSLHHACIGRGVCSIKPKQNSEFIYQFLLNYENKWSRISQGSTFESINSSDITSTNVVLPLREEQEKIASFFSLIDKKIELQTEKVEELKNYKKGLMQKIFSQELRFKGFSGEWESKKIGSICEIIMGQSPSSACYNEDKIGLPLIQGNADIKNRKTFPRVYTSDITKTCDVGDIIMSVRAPVGAISKSLHHACIGRGVCSIKPKQNSEFIYQFLLNYENKWSRISQGSTFESINSFDITSTNIVLPLKEEQEKIASFFSLIDKKLELEMEKLEQLQEYKKGLLQQMFI